MLRHAMYWHHEHVANNWQAQPGLSQLLIGIHCAKWLVICSGLIGEYFVMLSDLLKGQSGETVRESAC
jgi:hypothetical protein